MPKFKAKAPLVHNGSLIKIGSEVDLTQKQADRLKDKVEAAKAPGQNQEKK